TPRSCAMRPRSSDASTDWGRVSPRVVPRPPRRPSVLADTFLRSGKVRDLYELPDGRLWMVASDRISAFDVILPTPIQDKGRVLTGLSRFWFRETAGIVPNHLLGTDPALVRDALAASIERAGHGSPDLGSVDDLRGRLMVCRRAEVLPIEAV